MTTQRLIALFTTGRKAKPIPEWRGRYVQMYGTPPPPWRLGKDADAVVAWAREYRARHERKPSLAELMQTFHIPKTTAHRRRGPLGLALAITPGVPASGVFVVWPRLSRGTQCVEPGGTDWNREHLAIARSRSYVGKSPNCRRYRCSAEVVGLPGADYPSRRHRALC